MLMMDHGGCCHPADHCPCPLCPSVHPCLSVQRPPPVPNGCNQQRVWPFAVTTAFKLHQGSTPLSTACTAHTWCTRFSLSLPRRWLYSMHAKSVCSPSSREMSTLLKLRPGMRPRFLSQKMAQKLCRGRGGTGARGFSVGGSWREVQGDGF